MIGLIISILIFNFIAFKMNRRLTGNQIVHIWSFTIALQALYDVIIEFKFKAYWYFTPDPNWGGLLAHIALIPPVNMMFLNWYPFRKPLVNRIIYVIIWVVAILLYEVITLLPQPWGYFNYGWWELKHAAIIDPILFYILLKYYQWVCHLEDRAINSKS
jgi:hypothetical protein